MLRSELRKNFNIIVSTIITIVATLYFLEKYDQVSEETKYIANLVFYLALITYNLILGVYTVLSKKIDKK